MDEGTSESSLAVFKQECYDYEKAQKERQRARQTIMDNLKGMIAKYDSDIAMIESDPIILKYLSLLKEREIIINKRKSIYRDCTRDGYPELRYEE